MTRISHPRYAAFIAASSSTAFGHSSTFEPDSDLTQGVKVGGPSEAVLNDFLERLKNMTGQ